MNMKRNIITVLMIGILSLIVFNSPADALVIADQCPAGVTSDVCASAGPKDTVGGIVKNITNVLFFLIGSLSVVMIIYSGIRYVTSAGNPAGIKSAKDTLMFSVIGLIVAILSYAIVNFIVIRLLA